MKAVLLLTAPLIRRADTPGMIALSGSVPPPQIPCGHGGRNGEALRGRLRTLLGPALLLALAGLVLPVRPAAAQGRLPAGPSSSAPAPAPSTAAAAIDAAPVGRVIVHWRTDAAWPERSLGLNDRLQRLQARTGLSMAPGRSITEHSGVLRVRGLSSAQLADRLSRDPAVAHVEVDARLRRLQAAPVVNDPRFNSVPLPAGPVAGQWFMRAPDATFVSSINAVTAWQRTTGSPSVVVAVLDTGLRFDHPDLQGRNVIPGRDFIADDTGANRLIDGSLTSPGTSFLTAGDNDGRDDDASDEGDFLTDAQIAASGGVFTAAECAVGDYTRSSWHGTQVAGLIGAATDNARGVASVGRNVRVMPVRVLGKCGGFTSDIAAAMRWASGVPVPGEPSNPTPARVLNLSLGGGAGPCSESPTLQQAVAAASAQGAVVVVAAGNSEGQAVSRPANCPGAIAVAAVRHTGTKVGFSDLGPQVALSAPGGNCVNLRGDCLYPIVSTTNAGQTTPLAGTAGEAYTDGLNAAAGTSFSAPLVSATAALILSIRPDLTPVQVRQALQSGTRPFPSPSPRLPTCRAPDSTLQDECNCTTTTCGAGLLDVDGALAVAAGLPVGGASPPTVPVAPAPETGGGGGGGALGFGWLLALGLAVGWLRRLDRRSA